MSSRYRDNSLRRRRIVEEDVSPAIDLQVDKTWCEPGSSGKAMNGKICRKLGLRSHGRYLRSFNHYRGVIVHVAAIKDVVRDNGVSVHLVRVIFCKCLGWSMFKPRCVAS
jgi:hypothetical protein